MPESLEHKLSKKLAALILNGDEECFIEKGHRADACNSNIYAEVECKKRKDGRVCVINFYPRSCKKKTCNPLKQIFIDYKL